MVDSPLVLSPTVVPLAALTETAALVQSLARRLGDAAAEVSAAAGPLQPAGGPPAARSAAEAVASWGALLEDEAAQTGALAHSLDSAAADYERTDQAAADRIMRGRHA